LLGRLVSIALFFSIRLQFRQVHLRMLFVLSLRAPQKLIDLAILALYKELHLCGSFLMVLNIYDASEQLACYFRLFDVCQDAPPPIRNYNIPHCL